GHQDSLAVEDAFPERHPSPNIEPEIMPEIFVKIESKKDRIPELIPELDTSETPPELEQMCISNCEEVQPIEEQFIDTPQDTVESVDLSSSGDSGNGKETDSITPNGSAISLTLFTQESSSDLKVTGNSEPYDDALDSED